MRTVPVNLKADVGEEFIVHVWLDNPLEKRFNTVSFALAYDPRLLEFIDAPGGVEGVPNGFDRSETILQGVPLVRDPREDPYYINMGDLKAGMVYYRARSASGEATVSQGFVLSMKFKALKPVRQTGLRFIFSDWPEVLSPPVQSDQSWDWPASMTFVGMTPSPGDSGAGVESLLGSEASTQDGVISGNLTLKGDYLADEGENEAIPEGDAKTRIFLQPGVVAVQAGKTFDLNINIANPEAVAWDRVRLDLRYDPEYLAVVDQDEGNWINRGVNVLDGPYHDRFPFEWMRNNLIREDVGRILYECGVFRSPLRTGGTVATIRLRALRSTPETKIVFAMPADVSSRDGTVLARKRKDVLGDTEYTLDGVAGATVLIVPPRDVVGDPKGGRQLISEKE